MPSASANARHNPRKRTTRPTARVIFAFSAETNRKQTRTAGNDGRQLSAVAGRATVGIFLNIDMTAALQYCARIASLSTELRCSSPHCHEIATGFEPLSFNHQS